jgi:hypothetical protein
VQSPPPPVPSGPTFGATPTFAPRPQPSAFTATPILSQPLPDEEEPEVIKCALPPLVLCAAAR